MATFAIGFSVGVLFVSSGLSASLLYMWAGVYRDDEVPKALQGRQQHLGMLNNDQCVVFLGESTLQFAEWSELLPEYRVANRSLQGCSVSEMSGRAERLGKFRPSAVVLQAGMHDLQALVPVDEVVRSSGVVLALLKSLNCPIVVLSLPLPSKVNESLHEKVRVFNEALKQLAQDVGTEFLDVNEVLSPTGHLSSKYTEDGTELNGYGYAELTARLRRVFQQLGVGAGK